MISHDWQRGDFAVVRSHGRVGQFVEVVQGLAGGSGDWAHAIVGLNPPWIVEAEPGGAVKRRMHYDDADVCWSTGRLNPELDLRERQAVCVAAEGFARDRVPYSFADYAALAVARLKMPGGVRSLLPVPGLRHYVASTHHMICSQLVDEAYRRAGYPLFDDGRWPGYVMPDDLAGVIGAPRRAATAAR